MKNNYVPRKYLTKEEQQELFDSSIKRFEEYIKEQLEQSEEKKMEQTKISEEIVKTQQEETNMWDNIGGDYIKLERDKAKMLLLVDWTVQQVRKFKDDKGNLKDQIEFSATVLSEDGQPCKKIFSTTSFGALKGLKEIFNHRPTNKPIMIRIKKIGEGKSTVYDIEEQKY